MKTTRLIFSLSFFLILGCSSSDDEFTPTLPAITQTGANTFGCYIDGVLLTPRDGSGSVFGADRGYRFTALGQAPNYLYNEIQIIDYKSSQGGLIDIHLVNLHGNGEFTHTVNESNCLTNVDANESINIRCRIFDEATQAFKWYCSIEDAGTLTITRYDFDNRIVSGTFSCTAQNRDNSEDSIQITQGRFDIKWDTLPDKNFQ